MEGLKIEIVVTRHAALVEYLNELGLIDENTQIVSHASPDVIKSKNVLGVLPHSLSCLTATFSEIPLNLPPEKRGQELTLEDMRQFSGELTTYVVTKM